MCHTNTPPSPPPPSSSDLKTKDSAISGLTPPRRKNRTKTRKPKFVSLRLQLSPNDHKPSTSPSPDEMGQQQQLNLFPLHPENLVDDKDMMHDDHNVALLFSSHGPATLNGLLEQDSTTTTATTEEEECLTRCPLDDRHGTSLLRKAMKRRNEEEEREEERWVCYSEVTSYCSATTTESAATTTTFGLLSLKLDYEGILNAWSDKGPLYVPGERETPHSRPPFPHHVLPLHDPEVVWGNSGSVVGKEKEEGEEERGRSEKKMKGKEEGGWKKGQREASVLRYKEKRQSRLFSKRIRYEVRKLNAEKRPRVKGRFVKRD